MLHLNLDAAGAFVKHHDLALKGPARGVASGRSHLEDVDAPDEAVLTHKSLDLSAGQEIVET